MKTAIVPIIKNKTGDTSDKNNYRRIALVTACSKIFELCILSIIENYICTHDHQFGFKKQHATDMCIYTVKSVIKYYTRQNSPVYTCFLDASKAFDRISHWTLFKKLIACKYYARDNLDKFAAEIKESKICERINSNADADPNANLDILTNIINAAKNNNIPQKVKKFNKRRDKKEPWMTNELLLMVNRKNELYVDWKRSAEHSENYNGKKVNFKTYEKIVDNEIVQAKKSTTQMYSICINRL